MFSSNIDNILTERGRFRDDNTALTDRVAKVTERVTALSNELAQLKSEIDIENDLFMALEEVKVAIDVKI